MSLLRKLQIFAARSFADSPLVPKLKPKVDARLKKDRGAFLSRIQTIEQAIKDVELQTRTGNKYQIVKPYMKWIFNRYSQGHIRSWEDVIVRAIPDIIEYHKLKSKLPTDKRDIIKYKKASEIREIIEEFNADKEFRLAKAKEDQQKQLIKSGEAEVFYKGSNVLVIIPRTFEASCAFGTKDWCTVRAKNTYDEHVADGPLYIIMMMGKPYYQFHFETMQFMDKRDDPIDILKTREIFPILRKIFKDYIQFAKNPSESMQMEAIEDNPYDIIYVDKPTEEAMAAALSSHHLGGAPSLYVDIKNKNPTEKVDIAAARVGVRYALLKNKTPATRLAAIEYNPHAIHDIDNYTAEMAKAVIKGDYELTEKIHFYKFSKKERYDILKYAITQVSVRSIIYLPDDSNLIDMVVDIADEHTKGNYKISILRVINQAFPGYVKENQKKLQQVFKKK